MPSMGRKKRRVGISLSCLPPSPIEKRPRKRRIRLIKTITLLLPNSSGDSVKSGIRRARFILPYEEAIRWGRGDRAGGRSKCRMNNQNTPQAGTLSPANSVRIEEGGARSEIRTAPITIFSLTLSSRARGLTDRTGDCFGTQAGVVSAVSVDTGLAWSPTSSRPERGRFATSRVWNSNPDAPSRARQFCHSDR